MLIRNLTNNEVASIANCESEPIHIPGSIQPHGFLLGIKDSDYSITYCSENCEVYLHHSLNEILGKNLDYFFKQEQIENFKIYYLSEDRQSARPYVFSIKEKSYHTTAHQSGPYIVLEFEPFTADNVETPSLFLQAKRFIYHTERADNLIALCSEIANETRLITGYDRVMVYRFDEKYNGEVIAESKSDDLESWLGLHYPHTDIPVQARELYLRNHMRMIADVNYVPVPLYARDEVAGKPVETLDLSLSFLRSVSPIHIQYLKNMVVGATFSISLVHNKKLWGLISCHHSTPKFIPYYTRLSAHLQSIFLSSQIDVRQIADDFELVKNTEIKMQEAIELLSKEEVSITEPVVLEKIKNVVNADGLLLIHKGEIFANGIVPDAENIPPFVNWLLARSQNDSFYSSCVIDSYPGAKSFSDKVAGLFYKGIDVASKTCIVWLCQPTERTIHWAGDPNKALAADRDNRMLTPRKSFELWKESVKNQSRDWKKPELNAALLLCSSIQRKLHLIELKEEEIRFKSVNERLKIANDELANMNWISTHDLKEPLRKIQIYASLILEKQQGQIPEGVLKNISRMQTSAAKMQLLIEDLMAYTKIVNEEVRFADVDMNLCLIDVKEVLKDSIEERNVNLSWGLLPKIKGIPFQIRQLFINLVSNSIKFSKENVPCVIRIECEEVTDHSIGLLTKKNSKSYYKVTTSDNGIGFNSIYKNDILKIFQRLHTNQYHGTGIGLAICKKIVEAHGGLMEADGEENKGAVFTTYFPVPD
jgi:two-component system, chemotaxis family, sensor kinase Cph1